MLKPNKEANKKRKNIVLEANKNTHRVRLISYHKNICIKIIKINTT